MRVSWQVITGHHEGVAEIALSHLRKNESYKEPVLVEGIRGHHPHD